MQRLFRYFLVCAVLCLASVTGSARDKIGTTSRPIRLGVMLPLNNTSADGQHMVEYYRGVLMACDSLKKLGVSVDIRAWDVTQYGPVSKILEQHEASMLDVMIGPLYANKVQLLSDFSMKHGIMMVVPFAIDVSELSINRRIFQIYQTPAVQNGLIVSRVCSQFKNYHPVIVDCTDAESTKGPFTAALRGAMDQLKMKYSLTSLSSPDNRFVKAFDKNKPNLVILNSARLSYITALFEKLNTVKKERPEVMISTLGYEEWLAVPEQQKARFHEFDVYVPSVYYTSLYSPATERLVQLYRKNFHQEMLNVQPRYALTGFDQAFYFLRGLYKYGRGFDGDASRFGYPPVQTPLSFKRVGNGGFQNCAGLFVHYLSAGRIETIRY